MTGRSPVATMEGRKTQTRRVVNPQPPVTHTRAVWFSAPIMGWTRQAVPARDWHKVRCPYGVAGDNLWVKEPWAIAHDHIAPAYAVRYDVDGVVRPGLGDHFPKNRPAMFMPRWASRILLEVTEVRVERLQEISCEDILAEGIEWPKDTGGKTNREVALATFEALWNKINAKRGYGWNENPWVFAISYKVIEGLAPAASHSV